MIDLSKVGSRSSLSALSDQDEEMEDEKILQPAREGYFIDGLSSKKKFNMKNILF